MVIVDTSIIIDHLRQKRGGETNFKLLLRAFGKEYIGVSILSIQELYSGQSTKKEAKEQQILAVISPLSILPYSYEIGQLAGQVTRNSKRPIGFADAAIAATGLYYQYSLATLNLKDFQGIAHLDLVEMGSLE